MLMLMLLSHATEVLFCSNDSTVGGSVPDMSDWMQAIRRWLILGPCPGFCAVLCQLLAVDNIMQAGYKTLSDSVHS